MQFAIAGDLRFLSHHDALRMFERAAVRGRLPLRYSAGFNPNPRLSLPLPRPVGTAGLQEWLLLQLTEDLEPATVGERLDAQLAGRITIRECWRTGSDTWQATEARYEAPLAPGAGGQLPERIAHLMAASSAVLQRGLGPGKGSKSIDARPFVASLEFEGDRLHMRLRFIQGATVRPAEVLELLGLPAQPHASHIVRTAIEWGPRDLRDGYICRY